MDRKHDLLSGSTTKTFLQGTHRVMSPADTLASLEPLRVPLGITRLADVTGLDTIGLPVIQAVRPNSRSISVSQGKGLDVASARASALMEAIEGYHAERVGLPLFIGSWAELTPRTRHRRRCAHGPSEPRAASTPTPVSCGSRARTCRMEGACSSPSRPCTPISGSPLPEGSGCFAMSSNGLAAGNHLHEALSHAICEVVERDSFTLWAVSNDLESTRLDPATVDGPVGVGVARAVRTSRVRRCAVGRDERHWHPGHCRLPSPQRGDSDLSPTFGAHGYGCHPAREVALSRALTEAAQSRLTHIAGSRDDKNKTAYAYALTSPVRASIADDGPRPRSTPVRRSARRLTTKPSPPTSAGFSIASAGQASTR